jgi:hypothetical protein
MTIASRDNTRPADPAKTLAVRRRPWVPIALLYRLVRRYELSML